MRCRAVTLAATVEGPGFPLFMANRREEQKLKEKEEGRVRGAVPPLPLFIKGRRGGTVPRTPPSSFSFNFCSSLLSAIKRENLGSSTVAARIAARQRVPPSPAPAVAEPATKGRVRGRGRGRGRGARGT